MKNSIIGLIVLLAVGCSQSDTTKSKMEQAKIVEMVLWKSKEGINAEEAKHSITQLNDFVKEQPGFISRRTALAEDGKFLDIVLWEDISSAKAASAKAMQNEKAVKIFSIIDEKEMSFQHFEIFNQISRQEQTR